MTLSIQVDKDNLGQIKQFVSTLIKNASKEIIENIKIQPQIDNEIELILIYDIKIGDIIDSNKIEYLIKKFCDKIENKKDTQNIEPYVEIKSNYSSENSKTNECGPQATYRRIEVIKQVVEDLPVKDKRYLYNSMREQGVDETFLFPKYGITAGEFATMQVRKDNSRPRK